MTLFEISRKVKEAINGRKYADICNDFNAESYPYPTNRKTIQLDVSFLSRLCTLHKKQDASKAGITTINSKVVAVCNFLNIDLEQHKSINESDYLRVLEEEIKNFLLHIEQNSGVIHQYPRVNELLRRFVS